MKKEFSKEWKASKQPRKQRKYLAKAPLHLRKKLLSVNLSKELRAKVGKRNVVVHKGDKVKIMRGKFKGKQGKVTEVQMKKLKLIVEGILVKKLDGSKVNAPMRASNLQIIEMIDRKMKPVKEVKTETKKVEEKKKEETKTTKKEELKPKVEEKK